MKIVTLIFLFINVCFAIKPDIEGGKDVPNEEKFKSFIRIRSPNGFSCSATKVAEDKILTAGHCVLDHNLNYLYKLGDEVLNYGTVKKIELHPDYISKKKELAIYRFQMKEISAKAQSMSKKEIENLLSSKSFKDLSKKMKLMDAKTSQSDIAFLTFNKKFDDINYPQIITKNHSFKERKKIQIVGFGATKKSWNQKTRSYQSNFVNANGQLANSCWSSAPNNYSSSIKELSDNINGILTFNADITHTIYQNKDIQKRSQNMMIHGDSGSAAIEFDKKGNSVITAIASTTTDYSRPKNNMTLYIARPGQESLKIVLDNPVSGWGDPKKKDLDFPEVIQHLKRLGLYEDNKALDGVEIKREFTRNTTATFADLLHPDNQTFIKSVMDKK